ncbi:MAG: zinc ribbon domain-containing protein [Candidatus Brocadiia bacterium]
MEPTRCPKCGNSYGPDLKFCPNDGTPLEAPPPQPRRCATCGTEFPEGISFCPLDGGIVGDGTSSPQVDDVNPPRDFDEVCKNGYNFGIGETIGEAASLLHKQYTLYLGALIVWFIISFILLVIPWLALPASFLVCAPMAGGFASMFLTASGGGEPVLKMLFSQFSIKYFPYVGANLLKWLILWVPSIFAIRLWVGIIVKLLFNPDTEFGRSLSSYANEAYQQMAGTNFTDLPAVKSVLEAEWGGMLLLFGLTLLIASVLIIYLIFVNILVVDRTNNPFVAVGKSVLLAQKQFWKISSLVGIMLALNLVAIIPCGLGLLYTVPLSFAVLVTVYVKAVGVKTIYE